MDWNGCRTNRDPDLNKSAFKSVNLKLERLLFKDEILVSELDDIHREKGKNSLTKHSGSKASSALLIQTFYIV